MQYRSFFSFLLSIIITVSSLFTLGCREGHDRNGNPTIIFFTGGLYEQGARTTDLRFHVHQDSTSTTTRTGWFSIGGDGGDFKVETQNPGCIELNGQTNSLRFGLKHYSNRIDGSSPSSQEALVWNIQDSLDITTGNQVYTGVIYNSVQGDVPVNLTVRTDGSIDGRLTYRGVTIIMNGFIDANVLSVVPKSVVVSLLILSAIESEI